MRTGVRLPATTRARVFLSALQARDVFCGDAVQDRVCIIQPRADKGSSDSTDR